MTDKRRKNAATYRAKMSEDNELKNIWIPKPDVKRLENQARAHGWLADTGRNAGKMNFQQAVTETLKAGLDALEEKQ